MALKTYRENYRRVAPKPTKPTPSGVACKNSKQKRNSCAGEYLWREPREEHPELAPLCRADCNKCGALGWV